MVSKFWAQTLSGKKFDLLNPQPDQVSLHDIAAGLSKSRYSCQIPWFYSVTEHSINVFDLCSPPAKPVALFHDAPEFITGDWTKPTKMLVYHLCGFSIDERIERPILSVILEKYGIRDWEQHWEEVKHFDEVMLATEKKYLMAHDLEWDFPLPPPIKGFKFKLYGRKAAYRKFLEKAALCL